jgi:hypothetical protein
MTPKEVRSRRLALGTSVDELAREFRVPASEIREIEAGERAVSQRAPYEQTFARLERTRGTNAP